MDETELEIRIYGTGCAKCKRLEQEVRDALTYLGIEAIVTKVTAMKDIVDKGVFMTPALEVNENLLYAGRIPPSEELRDAIKEHYDSMQEEK